MGAKVGSVQTAHSRAFGASLTTPLALQGVLVGGAALYVLAFVGAALARLVFAYPLEITEGASLEQVRSLLRGQPLYDQPTLEHVSMIYGPVYFYAAALLSLIVGPTYAALRLVSLAASICSIALTYLIVNRETGSRLAGLVACGMLAASYPLLDGTLDLGRVDALLLACLLGALYASRLPGTRSAAIGGVCMALAVLTKQAAVPVAILVLVYLAVVDRRRLLAFGSSLVAAVAVPVAVLEAQSGHWATLFLLQLPRQHEISELRVDLFWRLGVLPRFTLALAMGMLFVFARLRRSDLRTLLFYSLVTIGMLGIAWASDANLGAAPNVLLPAYAMLSILFGLGLHEGLRQLSYIRDQQHEFWTFGICVGLLQLVLLIYNPRLMVPYRSDTWADDRLASTLSALPGTVFAPDFDAFVHQGTDRPDQPYSGAIAEVLGGYGGSAVPEGSALMQTLRDRLQQRQYDYVVLDPDSQWFFLSGAVRDAGYADAGPVFPPGDDFWLWRRGLTPKSELYIPQERQAH